MGLVSRQKQSIFSTLYITFSVYKILDNQFQLMLDREEVFHLTKLGYDVQQIASIAKCHLLLILVKLLALWYNMTRYYSQHSQFLQEHQELAHFSFCP